MLTQEKEGITAMIAGLLAAADILKRECNFIASLLLPGFTCGAGSFLFTSTGNNARIEADYIVEWSDYGHDYRQVWRKGSVEVLLFCDSYA